MNLMKKEFDFVSQEASWEIDGISVNGTMTVPKGDGLYPGIVFVAGSGPTDRNWESPLIPGTNGSGRLLAETLSGTGFICLRYDKRASGPFAVENIPRLVGKMSMRSHLEELIGAVDTLLETPKIDKNRLFSLTNSEGAIHALHYQKKMTKNRFNALVLTGAPGRAVGDVARSQLVEQLEQVPNNETILAMYDRAIESYVSGENVAPDTALPESIQQIIRGLSNPANLPFARELWITDPSVLLADIKEPVLVVIGKKDVQVDWQADGGPLQKTTRSHKNVEFVFPENANHVLKNDETPRDKIAVAEVAKQYNAADTHLDDEAVSIIVHWLKKQQ